MISPRLIKTIFLCLCISSAASMLGLGLAQGECNSTVLLVVNDYVVTRNLSIDMTGSVDLGGETDELSDRQIASSLLTQYFVASPLNIFEPNATFQNLLKRERPQKPKEFLNLLVTLESDFIVTASVSTTVKTYQLNSGGELYGALARVTLTAYRSASAGNIVSEKFLTGESRYEFNDETSARQAAVSKAIVKLLAEENRSDLIVNATTSPLISDICDVGTATISGDDLSESCPDASLVGRAQIEAFGLTDYSSAVDMKTKMQSIPCVKVTEFILSEGGTQYHVSLPPPTTVDDLALMFVEDSSFSVIRRSNDFLELKKNGPQ